MKPFFFFFFIKWHSLILLYNLWVRNQEGSAKQFLCPPWHQLDSLRGIQLEAWVNGSRGLHWHFRWTAGRLHTTLSVSPPLPRQLRALSGVDCNGSGQLWVWSIVPSVLVQIRGEWTSSPPWSLFFDVKCSVSHVTDAPLLSSGAESNIINEKEESGEQEDCTVLTVHQEEPQLLN